MTIGSKMMSSFGKLVIFYYQSTYFESPQCKNFKRVFPKNVIFFKHDTIT